MPKEQSERFWDWREAGSNAGLEATSCATCATAANKEKAGDHKIHG
jgi:hypothetical protein